MDINQLAKSGTFELLQALILSNNIEAESIADTQTQLLNAMNTIEQQANRLVQQSEQLNAQSDTITRQNMTLKSNETLLLEAEKIAQVSLAKNRELGIAKAKISELQQSITGLGNAKKMANLVKTQKAKAVERNKRIERLEREAKEHVKELKAEKIKVATAVDKVREQQRILDHNTGAGLYHNGDHHLVIWPEKTTIKRADGSMFEARSLLYLHQSGNAKIVSFDPEAGEAVFCQMPRGGLRPSKEVKAFAKDWLYTVNVMQDGIVKDADMIAVNYNVELDK